MKGLLREVNQLTFDHKFHNQEYKQLNKSLNQGQASLKTKNAKVQDLEIKISVARVELIRMKPQLFTA